jgi:undecaprenyl-diphosphatase
MIATPDGLLLPCWAGACFHASRAMDTNRWGQWLLTGFWFGCGMLSKYTMLLFLPSLLLCFFFIRPYRKRLFQPAPWLGLFLGLLVFTPVLIWNSNNEWATFRHVLYMGGIDAGGFFTLRYLLDFLLEQTALLSPLVFFVLLAAWLSGANKHHLAAADVSFLVWTSLPTFLVFFFLALHSRVYGNWPAAGYLTGIVLIAAMHSTGRSAFRGGSNRIWLISVCIAYLVTVPVLIQVVYPALPLPAKLDRTARETVGWDTLGQAVNETMQSMPDKKNTFIFGLRYQLASELAFYVPGRPRTVSINRWSRPNVYDFWFNDTMLIGQNGIGITEHKEYAELLNMLFNRVELDREVPIFRDSPWLGRERVTTFYIFRAYGFRGGQRWQPPDNTDIRATKKQTGS